MEHTTMLAKITSARLEIKDRGILMFYIYVDYEDGGCQAVGGICLDTFNKEKDSRVGTAFGCEVIRRLLLELQVNDFSEMKGKHIYVIGEGSGFSFIPKGIRSLYVDNKDGKPVIFDEILKEFGDAK